MKTKISRKSGFTLVEIMIVVAIIGLLAAIAIPNFLRARSTAQQNACINNLRQIDSAKQQWALEEGKGSADTPVDSDIQPYLGRGANGTLPKCPLCSDVQGTTAAFDASYTVGDMSTAPLCKLGTQTDFLHVLPGTSTST